MLPPAVQHMRASGVSLFFHHLSHHPMTLAAGRLCWCFLFVCLLVVAFVLCFVGFLFCKCHRVFSNPPRVLDLDDRQGFIASSAMQ